MFTLFNTLLKRVSSYAFILSTLVIIGCGGGGGGSTPPPPAGGTGTTSQVLNVTINWAANRETKVNTTGGGYTVYISQASGFNIADGGVTTIPVPYVSGALTPITTQAPLSSGTHYVRVVAFGLVNGSTTTSAATTQATVTVPFTTP